MAPKVYSYIRYSTPRQGGEEKDSFDRQVRLSRDWCARRGLVLEEKSYEDLGVSAFKGANSIEGNLRRFIVDVQAGRIPKNSILLVENLDRISRQKLASAIMLFITILELEIKIATLSPDRFYDSSEITNGEFLTAVLDFGRAHEESQIKSQRVRAAWTKKRLTASERPLTARGPAWLELQRGKWHVNKSKAKVVKKIYSLVNDGWGVGRVVRWLNLNNIPSFQDKTWSSSSVFKILHNRAVIGEFQPHQIDCVNGKNKRVPVGETINNYYPQIIVKNIYDSVQYQMNTRTIQSGKIGKTAPNLFTGLLYWKGTKKTLSLNNKGSGRNLVASDALKGLQGYISFSYDIFEKASLSLLGHLDPYKIFPPKHKKGSSKLTTYESQLIAIKNRSLEIQRNMALVSGTPIKELVAAAQKLEDDRKSLEEKIQIIKNSESDLMLCQMKSLHSSLWSIPEPEAPEYLEFRLNLRDRLRQIISRIDIEIIKINHHQRQLNAVFHFMEGKKESFSILRSTKYVRENHIPKQKVIYVAHNPREPKRAFFSYDGITVSSI